jgi:hypothetical protein
MTHDIHASYDHIVFEAALKVERGLRTTNMTSARHDDC